MVPGFSYKKLLLKIKKQDHENLSIGTIIDNLEIKHSILSRGFHFHSHQGPGLLEHVLGHQTTPCVVGCIKSSIANLELQLYKECFSRNISYKYDQDEAFNIVLIYAIRKHSINIFFITECLVP
uniref:Uncharacterized protein n=1 Tax=Rhizophagus irregularis (strain DAOM 181602 / DAOM 197198 / MUCL 43194) TaxID=747089 RepID=U9UBJ5_RHIID